MSTDPVIVPKPPVGLAGSWAWRRGTVGPSHAQPRGPAAGHQRRRSPASWGAPWRRPWGCAAAWWCCREPSWPITVNNLLHTQQPTPVTLAKLATLTHDRSPMLWITVRHGRVLRISEQWVP